MHGHRPDVYFSSLNENMTLMISPSLECLVSIRLRLWWLYTDLCWCTHFQSILLILSWILLFHLQMGAEEEMGLLKMHIISEIQRPDILFVGHWQSCHHTLALDSSRLSVGVPLQKESLGNRINSHKKIWIIEIILKKINCNTGF